MFTTLKHKKCHFLCQFHYAFLALVYLQREQDKTALRKKKTSDQNHLWPNPPSGKKTLRPKPLSCKNPPLAKTPLIQKAPSGKKKKTCQPLSSP